MGFHRFFLAAMRDEPTTVFGDGRQTRDFTFVSDAVGATIAASTRGTPGAVYNIGGGSRVELLDVFELIGRISGRRLRLETIEPQPGDMRDTYADTTRARQDLGFVPSVTLEQGLEAQFQWMSDAGLFNA
jgi:nucleoside-diphosphate-sugar epimerase